MEVSGQALASTSGAPAAQPRSLLAEEAAALLHKRCKIRVKDGRVLVGEFCCLDKQGNIILQNTFEHMTLNGAHHEKLMGQVLVPATHRVACDFEALPADAAQMRQLLGTAR